MIKKRSYTELVSGIVVPSQWDKTGKIVGITIQSFNEIEYIVERNKAGLDFNRLLQKKVEAVGSVKERLDGKKIISVKEFKLIENGNHVS